MKSIESIRQEILQSMKLDTPEITARVLTEVYGMPSFFRDGHIFLTDEDLQFTPEAFTQTITHIVRRASREEILENYEQLTQQQWEWIQIQDEPDCHPELFHRNKS